MSPFRIATATAGLSAAAAAAAAGAAAAAARTRAPAAATSAATLFFAPARSPQCSRPFVSSSVSSSSSCSSLPGTSAASRLRFAAAAAGASWPLKPSAAASWTLSGHRRALSSSSSTPSSSASGEERETHVVFSVIGKDRVGIVRDLAKYLASLGGNVEESRMARLGGEFAVIVLVSLKEGHPKTYLQDIRKAFPDFLIHSSVTEDLSEPADSKLLPLHIEVEGPDSTGIVLAVTEKLGSLNASVANIETRTTSAPFAGYPVFQMSLRCHAAEDSLPLIYAGMEEVEERFGLQIEVWEDDGSDFHDEDDVEFEVAEELELEEEEVRDEKPKSKKQQQQQSKK